MQVVYELKYLKSLINFPNVVRQPLTGLYSIKAVGE